MWLSPRRSPYRHVGGAGGVEQEVVAEAVRAGEWVEEEGALCPRRPEPGSLRAEGRGIRVVFRGE